MNSIKMKMSVIIGVLHMLVGLFFSLLNAVHTFSLIDVVCVVIPQFVMMLSLFGYLCFLIIYKWFVGKDVLLIRTMINMFLSFGKEIDPSIQLYEVQVFFVLFFFIDFYKGIS
jgi:V-type H+-transporting ATPase subunit a